jgi:hypothetical protein
MNEAITRALERDQTIDITTMGRQTGEPRRIETWFYRVGGRVYLSGRPGRRAWYANLLAAPHFTFHLKVSATADLAARAKPVLDPEERRRVLSGVIDQLGDNGRDLEAWVARSPLVEVVFEA